MYIYIYVIKINYRYGKITLIALFNTQKFSKLFLRIIQSLQIAHHLHYRLQLRSLFNIILRSNWSVVVPEPIPTSVRICR